MIGAAMTRGMKTAEFLRTWTLRGAGSLVLLAGIQACDESVPAPEVVLGTYNASMPVQGSVVLDTALPEVDSIQAVLRTEGKKKILVQPSALGAKVRLDSVARGASYSASVTGFENVAGTRVARWWAFAQDTADYSGSLQTILLRPVVGPSLDSLPKLDSLKVGVTVPVIKGLWITTDSTDPRASKTAKPVSSPLVLARGQSYRVALRLDSVATTGQPALWSALGVWNIRGNTPVPVFSVASGTYGRALRVGLSDSLPNATILWSSDSLTWNVYKDSLAVDSSGKIHARAVLKGMDTSRVVTATYRLKVQTPRLSVPAGTYGFPQLVRFSDSTSAVAYRCSADSLTWESCPDSLQIQVSSKLFVVATRSGWTPSEVVQATYELRPKAPSLSVPSGTYERTFSVVLSDSTPLVAWSCSADSLTWATCTDTLAVTASRRLFVQASRTGWTPSPVVRADYELKVGMPWLSVASGTYDSAFSVVLSDSTAGVTWACSSDSLTWNACQDTVPVTGPGSLFVQATKAGWTSSAVVKAVYGFRLAAPTFSVPAGTYPEAQTVALISAVPGAAVEWSMDGTTWTAYAAPLSILATGTLQARTIKDGWAPSKVASAAYVIEPPPATP